MVQTLLALICANSWHIHQIDVKLNFLNRDLKEKIYKDFFRTEQVQRPYLASPKDSL